MQPKFWGTRHNTTGYALGCVSERGASGGKTAAGTAILPLYQCTYSYQSYSNEPFYSKNANHRLMLATQDTRDIVVASMKALKQIWRDGYLYQKVGIILNDFCSRAGQIDIFDKQQPKVNSEQLMNVIDCINKEGIGNVWFAGQEIDKGWKMKREMLSLPIQPRGRFTQSTTMKLLNKRPKLVEYNQISFSIQSEHSTHRVS